MLSLCRKMMVPIIIIIAVIIMILIIIVIVSSQWIHQQRETISHDISRNWAASTLYFLTIISVI